MRDLGLGCGSHKDNVAWENLPKMASWGIDLELKWNLFRCFVLIIIELFVEKEIVHRVIQIQGFVENVST